MRRRQILVTVAALSAGCSGQPGGETPSVTGTSPTATPTPSPTATATASPTDTPTATATETPTPTETPTATATETPTPAPGVQHERADPEQAWTYDIRDRGGQVRTQGTVRLDPGHYGALAYRPQQETSYTVTVTAREGGPFDVFWLTDGQYQNRYREQREFEPVAALSTTETTGTTLQSVVAGGRYRFVVDNSAAYGAAGDDELVVAFTIAAENTDES